MSTPGKPWLENGLQHRPAVSELDGWTFFFPSSLTIDAVDAFHHTRRNRLQLWHRNANARGAVGFFTRTFLASFLAIKSGNECGHTYEQHPTCLPNREQTSVLTYLPRHVRLLIDDIVSHEAGMTMLTPSRPFNITRHNRASELLCETATYKPRHLSAVLG
jgi:hypothetical protein